MGLNRLLKRLSSGETLEEALYKKLTGEPLPGDLYEVKELGEGMGIVHQSISGWWKPRYILNHDTRTAFEFMSSSEYLLTVEHDDIEWRSLKGLPEIAINRAKIRFAGFPTLVGSYQNGVACVSWQLNPDGRYYMDDDGYGMTDDEEIEIEGYINKEGKVVGKFRLLGEKDKNIDYRKLAEEAELLNHK